MATLPTDQVSTGPAAEDLTEAEQPAPPWHGITLQRAIANNVHFYSIATDARGVIQLFNAGAERMLGYTAADVVNKLTPADICDPQELVARATALAQAFAAPIAPGFDALAHKAARGIDDIYELTFIRQDGGPLPAVVSVSALRAGDGVIIGYLMIGVDNTARKQAEDRLGWIEEGFRLMVDSVSDYAIVMLDPDGVVMSWNSGAEQIHGYAEEEIIGQPYSRFYPAADIAAGKARRDLHAAARGRMEDEGWRRRKDGSVFWANVVMTPVRDAQDELRGFAKLTRDLTESRRVDAALRATAAAAEIANRAKSDFLSSMSHELRSPLNAILGFAQLMESDTPPPTSAQQSSIGQILKGGWYLLDMLNEILDLAVIESGKLSLSLEPVSLSEVMRECQSMIAPQLQHRGIHLHAPTDDQPWFVHADRTRLKQVLINLLTNAIKYNRPGGTVALTYSAAAPGRILVGVRDTGAGLPPHKLARLFEPFNRLGQETTAEQGTGIGLVVSKRLVELMGGTIGVESTVDVGSEFWIELGAAEAPQVLADHTLPTSDPRLGCIDTPLRTLLYVEDNPANLKLVEQLIARRPDLRLLCAEDGLQGVEMARAHRPDLILMDLNLPGIGGIEASQRLREDPATATIPVVALTANATQAEIRAGLEAGFYRYLTKPIKVNEFFATLDEALAFSLKNQTASGTLDS